MRYPQFRHVHVLLALKFEIPERVNGLLEQA